MIESGYYIYTIIPQWGIFIGIILVILGVVEKKNTIAMIGWLALFAIGIYTLSINLFYLPEIEPMQGNNGIPPEVTLKTIGWQTSIGSLLVAFTLLLKYFKSKRFTMLGILSVAFFVIIFFQYYYFIKSIN